MNPDLIPASVDAKCPTRRFAKKRICTLQGWRGYSPLCNIPSLTFIVVTSDDALAVEVASRLIRDVGYGPVLIGGLEKGRYLMPGTALSGERSAEEIRKLAR